MPSDLYDEPLSEYENQEIADTLGISVRTVDAQIYHALKILKIKLRDYLPVLLLLFPHFLKNKKSIFLSK